MHRRIARIAFVITALTWPLSAFAVAPANVTGLAAHLENGQITVRWDAPEENIAEYRIYYGQRSILENGGLYDDFVATAGQNTEFTLTDFPPYQKIFLAVLAVNGDGEESASFVEEIELDLGAETSDSQKHAGQAVASPARREHEATTLGLLEAEAVSSVSIHLLFSAPISIPAERAVDAFTVLDEQGVPLRLQRITIEGSIVTLATEPQIAGKRYGVRANDVIAGDASLGFHLSMDPGRSTQTFAGYNGPGALAPFQHVTRPAPSPVAATVTAPVTPARGLASSGAPIVGITIVSTSYAAWRLRKKRAFRGVVERPEAQTEAQNMMY